VVVPTECGRWVGTLRREGSSTTKSHNGHPVDGALVGAGSLWLKFLS